jgi:hypothetical protein
MQDTNKTRFRVTPVFRYAFARKKPSGYMNIMSSNRKFRAELEGGRYIQQFNADDPILPLVNTFTTLLLEQNLMKLYEHDFVSLRFRRTFSHKWTFTTDWLWQDRMQLENSSKFKLVNRESIEDYTPNEPVNITLPDTSFPQHQALVGTIGFSARPWMKYRKQNNNKYPIWSSSPTFTVDYTKGFRDIANSDVDYDLLQLGIKYRFDVGARGEISFAVQGGMFMNNAKMYFMDYKHFLGNQTPFITNDPVGSFRLLDYYRHSTNDKYLVANVHYQFRKFIVTTIPYVRLAGIRENIFLNYLKTPTSRNYTEVGYSIDGILRMFRLEAAASFENGKYQDYGFRIGIATNITVNFND